MAQRRLPAETPAHLMRRREVLVVDGGPSATALATLLTEVGYTFARVSEAAAAYATASPLSAGPLILDVRAHEVRVGDALVTTTPREFDVLRLLLERRGEVLSSDVISSHVWGYETFGSHNFVEAQMSRLRAKLRAAGAPRAITTVRGVGYVIR